MSSATTAANASSSRCPGTASAATARRASTSSGARPRQCCGTSTASSRAEPLSSPAMGFCQFSHYFTDIRDALDRSDENEARRLLAEWRHLDASELPRTEVLRHVIEHALLAAHRHVFGVFFWFVVLSAAGLGPTGAVLY